MRSDEQVHIVGWRGDQGAPTEAVIRMPLKDLVPQLDPEQFQQVHRSVVVNLRSISQVRRGERETPTSSSRAAPKCCRSTAATCTCSGRCERGRRACGARPACRSLSGSTAAPQSASMP